MALTPVNYTPHVWANGEEGGTPINATRLNEIEGGIYDGSLSINEIIEYLQTEFSLRENQLVNDTYEGRNIEEIPEIQDELDQYGSVPAFLQARAQNMDSSYLNIGDWCYVGNTYMGDDWRYAVAAFWPYYKVLGNPSHIIMVPKDNPFLQTTAWRASGNNNGTASDTRPYPTSDLFAFEAATILPTYATAWQNVMIQLDMGCEDKYSSSGATSASGVTTTTLGKIWSPSPVEIWGNAGSGSYWGSAASSQFPYFRKSSHRTGLGGTAGSLTRVTVEGNVNSVCFISSVGNVNGSNRTVPRHSGSCFAIG